MPTTPTSMVLRLTGAEAFTDNLNFGTTVPSFGSTAQVLPAGTKIGGLTVDDANRLVTVAAVTTTLTLTAALHSGKVVLLQSSGGLVITPPAATGTGSVYTFAVTATIAGGSVTIDAKLGNASDVVSGVAWFCLSGGTTTSTFPTASNSNLITLNGTTTAGVKGTYLQMIDLATNLWWVTIEGLQTSTAATPFSNH